MKIVLLGSPRTTNNLYRHTCRGKFATVYVSEEGKSLKKDYQWQAKSQWKGPPRDEELEISVDIFFGTKRRCDWDNFHKLSMDALTGIVWEDDSQIAKATVTKHYDKENPRIEILIEEYEKLT